MNFFVRLVLGRPRVCPGDFTGFVPGTSPVKTWDTPGFSPYFTQWKPDFTGFVPGTNRVSLGQSRGRRAAQKVYVKEFMCLFRSLTMSTFLLSKYRRRFVAVLLAFCNFKLRDFIPIRNRDDLVIAPPWDSLHGLPSQRFLFAAQFSVCVRVQKSSIRFVSVAG